MSTSDSTASVLVDATTAEHATGIRVVIEGFLAGINSVGLGDQLICVSGPKACVPHGIPVRRIRLAATRPGRLLYQRLLVGHHASLLERSGLRLESILFLDSYAPLTPWGLGGRPATALVHDVLPLTRPEFWSRSQIVMKRAAFAALRARGVRLVTSSEFNAARIREIVGCGATVVRFGCGQISDAAAERFLTERETARGKYILCIGAVQPRKQVVHLVEAFRLLSARQPDMKLVIIGWGEAAYVASVRRAIAALPRPGMVRWEKKASLRTAVGLMRRASAVVFPSSAEGFGLPVLEGFAVGTPVIASAIPEVQSWAGAAATYVDPTDHVRFADALEEVARGAHPALEQGLEVARGYRWKEFARELYAAAHERSFDTELVASHTVTVQK